MFNWYYVFPTENAGHRLVLAVGIVFIIIYFVFSKFFLDRKAWKLSTGILFLVLWMFSLISVTILNRQQGGIWLELNPFWTVRSAWTNRDPYDWYLIVGNVGIFVPFGAAVALFFQKLRKFCKVGLLAFCCSLTIELIQLLAKIGLCELDDLFHNTMGALIGYSIYVVIMWIRRRKVSTAEKVTAIVLLGGWSAFFIIALAMGQPVFGAILV